MATSAFARQMINIFETRFDNFIDLALLVAHQPTEPVIHEFRVASRRLLTLAPIINSDPAPSKWQQSIRKSARKLNRVRDLQVLLLRFQHLPEIASLLCAEISQQRNFWQANNPKAIAPKWLAILDQAKQGFKREMICTPQKVQQRLTLDWQQQVEQILHRLATVEPLELKTIHKVRVSAKKLRYLVEVFQAIGTLTEEQPELVYLKYWQEKLGQLSDLDFAIEWLTEYEIDPELLANKQQQAQQLCQEFFAEQQQFEKFLVEQLTPLMAKQCSQLETCENY